jgi:tetratricopeptide (TPR) repeat protein
VKAREAMAQSRYAEAAESYRAAISAQKNNIEAHAGLADALFALARYDEIITLFPEEIRKGNINLNQRGPEAMAILKNIGFSCYRSGQSKKAIVALSIALKIQDDDSSVYNTLGLAYLKTGSLPRAEIAFQTAVNLAPASPYYVNNLGAVYLDQKRYREALICFEKAVRNNTGYHTGWENIWLCREKLALPSYRGEYWFYYFVTATEAERLAYQNHINGARRNQEEALAAKARQEAVAEEERLRFAAEEEERRAAFAQQQDADQNPETGETNAATLPQEGEHGAGDAGNAGSPAANDGPSEEPLPAPAGKEG